jgi:XisH protein
VPAKDAFHDAVKSALEKEGWRITHDPFFLRVGGVEMYIDLGAEKLIAAEKNGEKIAVEIKSFLAPSNITEFHVAVGQFLNYRVALEDEEVERKLYLAVPQDVYRSFFTLPFIERVIERYQLDLIVYNPDSEAIVQWLT